MIHNKARPYLKNNQCKNGRVPAVECLPSKCEALSSNPSSTKYQEKTSRKGEEMSDKVFFSVCFWKPWVGQLLLVQFICHIITKPKKMLCTESLRNQKYLSQLFAS
jgi:hypothetical protein